MAKFTLGANIGIASVSTDVEIKNPIKKLKKYYEKKKQEREGDKIQNLSIGFWLSDTGACVERAVVRCSKREVKDRVRMENVKDPLKIRFFRRVDINDFFNEDEFVERPQDLSGYEGYTEDDFDFNYFIVD